jgi:hypothetical protein
MEDFWKRFYTAFIPFALIVLVFFIWRAGDIQYYDERVQEVIDACNVQIGKANVVCHAQLPEFNWSDYSTKQKVTYHDAYGNATMEDE